MTCITRRARRAPAHIWGLLAMVLPLAACGSPPARLPALAVETGTVTALAFSPQGDLLAVGTTAAADAPAAAAGANLQLWDVREGRRRHALRAHDRVVRQVAFDGAGRQLFTCGREGGVHVWDVASGERRRTIAAAAAAFALTRDGRWLVTADGGPTVAVWDAGTGTAARTLAGDGPVIALALGGDGRTLAVARHGLVTDVFDLSTGERRRRLSSAGEKFHEIEALALSADGRTLALGRQDTSVEIWDVGAGTLRHRFDAHAGFLRTTYPVQDLAFDPAGAILVSGGGDGTVRSWDVASGKRRAEWAARSAMWRWANPQKGVQVTRVAVSPEGTTIAAGYKDRTVRLWRLPKG